MKILITGAKGQLGKEFVKKLEHKKKKFLALGHAELGITDLEKIIEGFESFFWFICIWLVMFLLGQ